MTQPEKNRILNLQSDEYGEYYTGYIRHVVHSDLETQLKESQKSAIELFGSLDDEQALYRYETGKWSVKEVLGHVIDTESIFIYRALALARGESAPLAGYDHNKYVSEAGFDRFTVDELVSQYNRTRAHTLSLFHSFDDKELLKRGVVNGSNFTVRGLGFVIAGHELHHLGILKERYLDL